MNSNGHELAMENERLGQTITLAREQLNKAILSNEENKSAIISAKQELRDNTAHSVSGLWSSDGFEALVALSQYVNPVTDKLMEYEAVENRISQLENIIKSPYFARIDFKYDDEDTFEKVYIGRSSLLKDSSYDMYIYDWRSPIASVFYRFSSGEAFYEAPEGTIKGELGLKRQYEIKNGIMEYFFDADVQIVDEFLRKLLSRNTSPKMKTIVETIQKDQDVVIRDIDNELMMVQGVAGSGKTSIALHRAAYLMYQGLSSRLSAENIMILSPNALFEQYISLVLPELGEDNIVSAVFDDVLKKILHYKNMQTRNKFLENLITSNKYRSIIKESIEFKTSPTFLKILNRFIDDLPYKHIAFKDIYYNKERVVSKNVLKEKILLGRKETPLGMRLKQLEEFVMEAAADMHKQYKRKSEILKIKTEIKEITELDIRFLYRKLFSDEKYFYELAEGIELPHCISDIIKFTNENLNSDALCYDDVSVMAYFKIKLNGSNKYRHIKQVVIDEAQDYYPLHYELFKQLFPNAKYTILGDINQTLEKKEDLTLYEQIGSILGKKKKSLVIMDKSFRCTNEILSYSLKFTSQNVEIKSFNRQGYEPNIHCATDKKAFCDMIVCETKFCLEAGFKSIGLICKTAGNSQSLYESLKNRLDVKIITNESGADLQGIFIIPVYLSKGLEFDAVLICDADSVNYTGDEDKKLLYIGCTRALHRLNLFCKGTPSPLL